MKKLRSGIYALSIFSVAAPALAQTDGGSSKSITAVRTLSPITIDGRLDEAEWARAAVVTDLHEVRPREFQQPSQRTELLVMYDDDALYIGARVYETDPTLLTAHQLRNELNMPTEDRIKIVLDPYQDRRNGYEFVTNPNGVRLSGIFKGGEQVDRNWIGIFESGAEVNAEGWTSEMRIPFKTLSFEQGADWGINLVRYVGRNNEIMAWASRDGNIGPAQAGTLSGLTGITQGLGLDVVPSMNVTSQRVFSPHSQEVSVVPSLDVFYKLTSSINAALTLNTDFSATEVDNRQVDLTRFNLFFPEKRTFFLRESDIFEFGGSGSNGGDNNNVAMSRADLENGRPYFSRRIGLSATGAPVDIDAGLKITGRQGIWNFGAMTLQQADFGAVDATNIMVGRVLANVFEESSAGIIVTHGDPRTNLNTSLIGADFNYRNSRLANGRSLEASLWYQQTDTEGVTGDNAAFGASVSLPARTGWTGALGFKEIQANFRPAIGFVSRAGVQHLSSSVGYSYLLNSPWIRTLAAGIDAHRVDRIGGDLQSEHIAFNFIELESPFRDKLELRMNRKQENLLTPFEVSDGVFIPTGDYRFSDLSLVLESGAQRSFNANTELAAGDFYDGDIRSVEVGLGWRPSKHFSMGLTHAIDDVDLPGGSFTNKLSTANFTAAFSSSLAWINLIQYDNVSESIGINSRLHWNPKAGQNLYFVVNHNFTERVGSQGYESASTDITLKVDYTFRF